MKFNAYYNGEFTHISDLKIPLSDRSIYFGDGVYDAFIGRNKKIYLKEQHIARFISNAEKLELKICFDFSTLDKIFETLIEEYDGNEFFLYVQLSRNAKFRSHSYDDCAESNLLAVITPIETKRYDTVLELTTCEDNRYELCNVKTINLIPSVLASKKASREGCDEAVFHRGSVITECAHSNIFIIKDGILVTHPADNHILPGITRRRFIELAREHSIKTVEAKFTVADLINSDGIIITSTSKLAKIGVLKNSKSLPHSISGLALNLCKVLEEDYLNSTKATNLPFQ